MPNPLHDVWLDLWAKTSFLNPSPLRLDDLTRAHAAAFQALSRPHTAPRTLILGQNPSVKNHATGYTGIPFCVTGACAWMLTDAALDRRPRDPSLGRFWGWVAADYHLPSFFDDVVVWNFLPRPYFDPDTGKNLRLDDNGCGPETRARVRATCTRGLAKVLEEFKTVSRIVVLGQEFARPVKKLCEPRGVSVRVIPHPSGRNRQLNVGTQKPGAPTRNWADCVRAAMSRDEQYH